jgi:hypothetical protein
MVSAHPKVFIFASHHPAIYILKQNATAEKLGKIMEHVLISP